jgi:hypothetical protein
LFLFLIYLLFFLVSLQYIALVLSIADRLGLGIVLPAIGALLNTDRRGFLSSLVFQTLMGCALLMLVIPGEVH